ncbi:hypothetical protein HY633_00570 [Candidatus Uhrbacteria bacterium]|nr:hypothetical protein [Candidatus Uhrbacteria bacterium]
MLDRLIGSKTRVRLLRLFLANPKQPFFVRELTRKIAAQINAVRNELKTLETLGIVEASEAPLASAVAAEAVAAAQRKYYRLNTESLLYPELRALFLKARMVTEKDFVKKIAEAGAIQYLALLGSFVGTEGAPTDMVVVGKVNRDKLAGLIRNFEKEIGREVNYTVMTPQEYKYRRDVTDRFLYQIFDGKKIVVIDEMNEKAAVPVPV